MPAYLLKYGWVLLVFISTYAKGQAKSGRVLKLGGFINFTHSRYSGFTANFELERAWARKPSFTSGPRLDFTFVKDLGYICSGDIGRKYYVGYEFKFYPFYRESKGPYHGVFIGIEPLLLTKRTNDKYFRYGPGLGALGGYQHAFKGKFLLSLEGNMTYFQNINNERPPSNAQDRYFSLFICIKGGIRL